jgi:hypothetical protein
MIVTTTVILTMTVTVIVTMTMTVTVIVTMTMTMTVTVIVTMTMTVTVTMTIILTTVNQIQHASLLHSHNHPRSHINSYSINNRSAPNCHQPIREGLHFPELPTLQGGIKPPRIRDPCGVFEDNLVVVH